MVNLEEDQKSFFFFFLFYTYRTRATAVSHSLHDKCTVVVRDITHVMVRFVDSRNGSPLI